MNIHQATFSFLISLILSSESIFGSDSLQKNMPPVALEREPDVYITMVTKKVWRPKPTREVSPATDMSTQRARFVAKPAPVFITLDSDSEDECAPTVDEVAGKITQEVIPKEAEKVEMMILENVGVPVTVIESTPANNTVQVPNLNAAQPCQISTAMFVPDDSLTINFVEPEYKDNSAPLTNTFSEIEYKDDEPSTPPAPSYELAIEEVNAVARVSEMIVSTVEEKATNSLAPRRKTVSFNLEESLVVSIPRVKTRKPRSRPFGLASFVQATMEHIQPVPCYVGYNPQISSVLKRKADTVPLDDEPVGKRLALYGSPRIRRTEQYRLDPEDMLQREVFIPASQPWDIYQFCMVPNLNRVVLFNLDPDVTVSRIVAALSGAAVGLVPDDHNKEAAMTALESNIQLVKDMNQLCKPFVFVHLANSSLANGLVQTLVQPNIIQSLGLGQHVGIDIAPRNFDRNIRTIKIHFSNETWKDEFASLFSYTHWRSEKNMPLVKADIDANVGIATIMFHFERHAQRAAVILREAGHVITYSN